MENFENPLLYKHIDTPIASCSTISSSLLLWLLCICNGIQEQKLHVTTYNPPKYEKGGKNEEAQVISGTS